MAFGFARTRSGDTLSEILAAPDRAALLEWLAGRPLLHEDHALNACMLHAGLAPQWDWAWRGAAPANSRARLQNDPEKLFNRLYGDQPDHWDEVRSDEERLRFIANCFTRLRYIDADGRLMLRAKGSPNKPAVDSADPLVRVRRKPAGAGRAYVFGHWSTLGFFSNGRCHRPRYGLRLGRHVDGAALGHTRCEAHPGTLPIARRG